MFEGITSTGSINFIIVFLEGLLSFLSPCVIPLIPIYISYLAGNAKQTGEDGTITYQRKKVLLHTIFFILGISVTFFILGMSFSALGVFFRSNQLLFTRIGGIFIIIMGLIQIGFLDLKFLSRERKFNLKPGENMNPFMAFLLGFTFSFAWTPCVGPALSSVLILASGTGSQVVGNLLVLVYTAGFIIPFLLLGIFTTQVLNFLKKHQNLLKYTVKIGGLLLIIIGIMTFTGWMNGISRYLNSFTPQQGNEIVLGNPHNTSSDKESNQSSLTLTPTPDIAASDASTTDSSGQSGNDSASDEADNSSNNSPKADNKIIPAYDFTLVDQYGNKHTLSDYKGKVVFLNFWATWCPPCKKEIPDIEEIYQEYGKNEGDVIILGVANPTSNEYPNNQDVSKKEVIKFLDDNKYTFPVVLDETGDILKNYYISAFPTTFLIDKDGNIIGYAPGALTKDMMKNAIQQALASTK
ncbi:MAG TPA: cytochrome c biogenesis protein/redoxin [Mobilitalea sp.]|nr:cytochrome c biogenesis protein/redoxin [Mobilitalea sp.]